MKTTLLALLLLFTVRAHATWSLIQHPNNTGCAGTSCVVTTTSTGASHLIVVVKLTGTTGTTITGVTSSGGTAMTWVHCPSCAASVTGATADVYYTLASTSGNTSFTITTSASGSGIGEVIEYATTSGPPIYDTSAVRNQSVAAAPTSVALTLTGTNDVIVQATYWGGTVTGAPAPYSSPADFPGGDIIVGALNTASGSSVAFTPTTTDVGAFAGIAFKETVTTVTHHLSRPI